MTNAEKAAKIIADEIKKNMAADRRACHGHADCKQKIFHDSPSVELLFHEWLLQ